MDNNVKITILKNDNSIIQFFAETDFDNSCDIYTDIPIEDDSEFVEFEEEEPFYSTSLVSLLNKYKTIKISMLKTIKN